MRLLAGSKTDIEDSNDNTDGFEEDIYGPYQVNLLVIAEELRYTPYYQFNTMLEGGVSFYHSKKPTPESDRIFGKVIMAEVWRQICGMNTWKADA